MNKNFLMIATICFALLGCTAIDYQNENYKNIPEISIKTDHGNFIIQDKVKDKKLYVHRELFTDIMVGIAPITYNREAAQKYLSRKGCKVSEGNQIAGAFYEFLYSCGK